jgi:Translation elongation factor EF-1alpha (GTPase)
MKYFLWNLVYFFFFCPPQTPVIVDQLWSDDEEVSSVGPGENIKVKLKGIEEDDVSPGFVLCDPNNPARTARVFDAQVCQVFI